MSKTGFGSVFAVLVLEIGNHRCMKTVCIGRSQSLIADLLHKDACMKTQRSLVYYLCKSNRMHPDYFLTRLFFFCIYLEVIALTNKHDGSFE